MTESMIAGSAGLMAFLIILAFLWILLPFAVFGVKARIDQATSQARKANAVLKQINEQLVFQARLLEKIDTRLREANMRSAGKMKTKVGTGDFVKSAYPDRDVGIKEDS